MTALELLEKNYKGTAVPAVNTIGVNIVTNNNLDCNCVDSDCSTDGYEY